MYGVASQVLNINRTCHTEPIDPPDHLSLQDSTALTDSPVSSFHMTTDDRDNHGRWLGVGPFAFDGFCRDGPCPTRVRNDGMARLMIPSTVSQTRVQAHNEATLKPLRLRNSGQRLRALSCLAGLGQHTSSGTAVGVGAFPSVVLSTLLRGHAEQGRLPSPRCQPTRGSCSDAPTLQLVMIHDTCDLVPIPRTWAANRLRSRPRGTGSRCER